MDLAQPAYDAPVDVDAVKAHPELIVGLSTTQKYSLDADTLADIHLAALKLRFETLKDRIKVVGKYAEEQNIQAINSLEDGGFLLFPHTMYKSYPLSTLEKGQFDKLTRWLQALTAVDLSGVDASGCIGIDDWVDRLDAATDLRIRHSSGTTGKLSFIPTSRAEARTGVQGFRRYFQGFGDEPDAEFDPLGKMPFIMFGQRKGAIGTARTLDAIVEHVYGGDESQVITTNPVRMSADMLSYSGRLHGAMTRGERGRQNLSPALAARREAFAQEQELRPQRFAEQLEKMAKWKGEQVILKGILPIVVGDVGEALNLGYQDMFAPESAFFIAGGTKGYTLPEDYRAQVERFSGVAFPRGGYGMTEAASGLTRMCPCGRYHMLPNFIPYLLDPDTGAQLPRTGRQTGRFAFLDIATETRWGGFVTSDLITLNWGDVDPCPCGRKGAFIDGDIRRLSEQEGGDDKITCAAAPAVHDKALEAMLRDVG